MPRKRKDRTAGIILAGRAAREHHGGTFLSAPSPGGNDMNPRQPGRQEHPGYLAVILTGLLFTAPLPAAPLLPHSEELAPGVGAAGFADRYRCANCGWVALGDQTLLVDL